MILDAKGLQLVVSAVLSLALLAACAVPEAASDPEEAPPAASVGPVAVKTAEVQRRAFTPEFSTTGTLMPHRKAELRALAEGRIEALPVDIGSRVRRGDLLFEIRTSDYRIALQQAEAAVTRADATLRDRARERDRMAGLEREGSATEQDRDRAASAWEEAQAGLEEARALRGAARQALEDCTIGAPYDGAITARHRERGEYAKKGDPVVEIMDLSTLNAEVEVPERYAGQVGEGLEVEVQIRAVGRSVPGKVVAVNPKLDSSTRTFRVKVAVDNSDGSLQAGLFCGTRFRLRTRPGEPAVPAEAVVRDEGRTTVWIVEGGRVRSREISEAGEHDGWVFVERGLAGGETVVLGGGGLSDGAEVRM